MADLQTRTAALAAAMGSDVILGARPGGGWFAACDSEEVDGGGPEVALDQLIGVLRRREDKAARAHQIRSKVAERRFEAIINDVPAGEV
jgi:hypothetical protein